MLSNDILFLTIMRTTRAGAVMFLTFDMLTGANLIVKKTIT